VKKTLSFSNKPKGGEIMKNTKNKMDEKYEMNAIFYGVNSI